MMKRGGGISVQSLPGVCRSLVDLPMSCAGCRKALLSHEEASRVRARMMAPLVSLSSL